MIAPTITEMLLLLLPWATEGTESGRRWWTQTAWCAAAGATSSTGIRGIGAAGSITTTTTGTGAEMEMVAHTTTGAGITATQQEGQEGAVGGAMCPRRETTPLPPLPPAAVAAVVAVAAIVAAAVANAMIAAMTMQEEVVEIIVAVLAVAVAVQYLRRWRACLLEVA
jgi:hypothetical protein